MVQDIIYIKIIIFLRRASLSQNGLDISYFALQVALIRREPLHKFRIKRRGRSLSPCIHRAARTACFRAQISRHFLCMSIRMTKTCIMASIR